MVRAAVNFFGHAAVASWSADADPGCVLGAMLPDFATMCGGRLDAAREANVTRGIAVHHATDAVFHALPVVTGLMRELDDHLVRGGCARGPRRAAAHVGVELLLDGVLVDDAGYRAAYLGAIAHDAELAWRDAEAAPRFAQLMQRLRERGIPDDLHAPDATTTRIHRMLAHRPLLAPSADDLRAIKTALGAFQPRIVVAVEAVLRGVRAGLADLDDPLARQ